MPSDPQSPAPAENDPGTSRGYRAPTALDPGHVKVDERSFEQFLVFANRFGKLLAYYDSFGKVAGDWTRFFAYDVSFLLAEMAAVDTQQAAAALLNFERAFSGEGQETGSPADNRVRENEALKMLYDAAARIDGWYGRAVTLASRVADGEAIRLALESVIKKDLSPHYVTLKANRLWNGWLNDQIDEDARQFNAIWTHGRTAPAEPKPRLPPYESLIAALHTFNRVDRTLVRLAGEQLQASLEKPDHPPHTALYIAFLKLFEVVRDDLNGFTERHLDHYYRRVLKLREREAVPDTAHLVFTLAKQAEDFELAAGTLLRAGKDAAGSDIFYAIDNDVYLNRAAIASLKTLFVASAPNGGSKRLPSRVIRILASPVANSQDGQGEPLKQPERGWPTFGMDYGKSSILENNGLHAHLGLVIASPVLLLKEGQRKITLSIRFSERNPAEPGPAAADLGTALDDYLAAGRDSGYLPAGDAPDEATRQLQLRTLLADAFAIEASGELGWVPLEGGEFERRHDAAGAATSWVDLRFQLAAKAPAIVEARRAVHDIQTDPPRPALRLQLNPEARIYAYSFFVGLAIAEVQIRVEVAGLVPALSSNLGPIDPNQPFAPLGALPAKGSYLEIGAWELAQKSLESASLAIDWLNLPTSVGGFADYYRGYGTGIDNTSFTARLLAQPDRIWKELYRDLYLAPGATPFRLFADRTDSPGTLSNQTSIAVDFSPGPLPPVFSEKERRDWPVKTAPAVLRLELTGPEGAFGHEAYPRVLAQAVLQIATAKDKDKDKGSAAAIPNPPFVPMAKSLALNYTASERLVLDERVPPRNGDAPRLMLIRRHPFGFSAADARETPLFEPLNANGNLYIGLAGLTPPQTLTLLFQVYDSSMADKDSGADDSKDQSVHWSFLAGNQWQELDHVAVEKDTTAGLLRSGIIRLRIPREICTGNTTMPAGLYWLRASVLHGASRRPATVAVYTQAATATRTAGTGSVLPAGTLKEFFRKLPAIAAVQQPFPSSGGRAAETTADFRIRVAERLRHKQRAVQPADYERIVLDAFPEIGQVKCLTRNNTQGYVPANRLNVGEVQLVVVPARIPGADFIWPSLPQYVLLAVQEHVAKYMSPFAQKPRVRNPSYERLKLFATLRLKPDAEPGPALHRLSDEVAGFIAPWRSSADPRMAIGGTIGQGYLLESFIEERSYAQELLNLTVLHSFRDRKAYRTETWPPLRTSDDAARQHDKPIGASAPWSVLVPAVQHDFRLVEGDEAGDEPWQVGIGDLEVGIDLVIEGERPE